MRTPTMDKLLTFFLGFLFVLVVLELGLRITGMRYPLLDPVAEVPARVASCPECRRVLCVGDSYVYGIGASPGMDFPAQLERTLHERGERIQMFNAGIPGANTGNILASLPRYLATTDPDLVIVLAGGANRNNLFGLRDYQERSSWSARIEMALFRVRVIRLVRYALTRAGTQRQDLQAQTEHETLRDTSGPELYARWRRRDGRPVGPNFERASELLAVGDLDGALAAFRAGAKQDPGDAAYLWGMAECARGRRDYGEAQRLYEDAIALDPRDAVSHYSIGELYQDADNFSDPAVPAVHRAGIEADPGFARNYCAVGRWVVTVDQDVDGAASWFEKGIEVDPKELLCWSQMATSLRGSPHLVRLQALLERHGDAGLEVAELLPSVGREISQDTLDAWVRDDLLQIIDLSRQAGARVILQTYPLFWPANPAIRTVSRETDAPLLDMERHVEQLVESGVALDALVLSDGHYSDEGNRVTATELAELVIDPG